MVGFHGDSDGEAVRSYPARGPKASLGIYRHGLARAPAKRSSRGRFWGNGIPKSVPSAGCQLVKSLQARSSARLERYLDTVEVWGSSPHGPTIFFNKLALAVALDNAPLSHGIAGSKTRNANVAGAGMSAHATHYPLHSYQGIPVFCWLD